MSFARYALMLASLDQGVRRRARVGKSCVNGASPNHFFNGRYLRDNLIGLSLGSLAA
jgi:hypothetical protein